jgi:hypothetical protein
MNNLTAVFQSEIFRPVVSLVVPGFYGISTLTIAVWQQHLSFQALVRRTPGLATAIALLIALTWGLVAEDLGARIEQHLDERLKTEPGYENHGAEWFEYLRVAFDKEPVGHHYLRTLVLRLKFELGMFVSSVPFFTFAFFLRVSCAWRIGLTFMSAILAIYFLYEAKCSNKALSDLRREMLKRWTNLPQSGMQEGAGL